jgi:hypothetical protein
VQAKINTIPGWRSVAALAVNRVLKRGDEADPATEMKAAPPAAPPAPEKKPDLPPLDFGTGRPVEVNVERAAGAKPAEKAKRVESVTVLDDPARQRVRDAYVAARFTGVARSSHDLARVRAVIRAAETYFGDGNVRRAEELLDFAAALQPASEALPLARLEIALRLGDSEGYRRTAIHFRENHPRSARWKEISAFARTLYLTEAPFNAEAIDNLGDRAYLRPNWMSDGLELAPEFMPGDLRARVLAIENNQTTLAEREKEAA